MFTNAPVGILSPVVTGSKSRDFVEIFPSSLQRTEAGIEIGIKYGVAVAITLDVVNRYILIPRRVGGITTPPYGDKTFTDLRLI